MTGSRQVGPVGQAPLMDYPPKRRPVPFDGSIPKAIVTPAPLLDGTSTSVNGGGGGMPDTAQGDATDAEHSLLRATEKSSPKPVRGVARKSTTPKANSKAWRPRKCLWCWVEKEATEFPYPRYKKGKYRRRRGVCRHCLKLAKDARRRERARREKIRTENRTTWTRADGVRVRVCSECKVTKPLETDYYATKHRNGVVYEWQYQCRKCSLVRVAGYKQRQMADPVRAAKERVKRRAWQRSWRERNREKTLEMNRNWRERLKADPERYAAKLENDRMERLMRRQERGLATRAKKKAPKSSGGHEYVPSWPLAEALDAMSARGHGDDAAVICERAGVSPRALHRWRTECDTVRLTTADAVLVNLDLLWWEIWQAPEVEKSGSDRPAAVLAWIDRVWKMDEAHQVAKLAFEGKGEDDGA